MCENTENKKTKKSLKERIRDTEVYKFFETLFKEIFISIKNFSKPYKENYPMLRLPSDLKKQCFYHSFFSLFRTILIIIFTFLLKFTELFIEQKLLILAVLLFIVYQGKNLVEEILASFTSYLHDKNKELLKAKRTLLKSTILIKVRNKIFKYDEKRDLHVLLSNESINNSLEKYIFNLWEIEATHIFRFFEILSVSSTLVAAIITNTKIPQFFFVSLILFFSIVTFLITAYGNIDKKKFRKQEKETSNEQSTINTDLLRTPIIVKHDLTLRIQKLNESLSKSSKNFQNHHKKINKASVFGQAIETTCVAIIILYYVLAFDISKFSLSIIAEITANLVIVTSAISNIKRIAHNLSFHNENINALENEKADISLILDKYLDEINSESDSSPIDNINLAPFTIKYPTDSKNDTPFVLKSLADLSISQGEVAILTGPSGTGKSTFIKLLTDRIRIEKNDSIPSTSRMLFYDESLNFGSFTIFEELFAIEEDPDLNKMQEILENLHLWQEISNVCVNVWAWMKEKDFKNSLSNGQKQRLILAKILYWLDSDIDIVTFDECTSGLDDKSEGDYADAEKILEYLVRYCNKDKKRIVIISTHQNVDGFIQKLSSEYHFKKFHFHKVDNENVVEEI